MYYSTDKVNPYSLFSVYISGFKILISYFNISDFILLTVLYITLLILIKIKGRHISNTN